MRWIRTVSLIACWRPRADRPDGRLATHKRAMSDFTPGLASLKQSGAADLVLHCGHKIEHGFECGRWPVAALSQRG